MIMFKRQETSAGRRQPITRRHFIAGAGTAALGLSLVKPGLVQAAEANAKIDLGLVGCGGRGRWIADLFLKNGHYNVVAVADYFQDKADEAGQKLNVPEANRFSGLSGYRRLLERKINSLKILE